jgi:hypothetical protein
MHVRGINGHVRRIKGVGNVGGAGGRARPYLTASNAMKEQHAPSDPSPRYKQGASTSQFRPQAFDNGSLNDRLLHIAHA